jgi:hypothetical protein
VLVMGFKGCFNAEMPHQFTGGSCVFRKDVIDSLERFDGSWRKVQEVSNRGGHEVNSARLHFKV